MSELILKASGVSKYYPLSANMFSEKKGYIHALENANFELFAGETLGIVGESGSGKTTLLKSIVRMHEPTKGSLYLSKFDDEPEISNLYSLNSKELRRARTRLQYVFQDPQASLNPQHSVRKIVTEAWRLKSHLSKIKLNAKDISEKAVDLLELVGLSGDDILKYPHQFSGGQRQRISIARALAVSPQVLLCDEPVSSLDVSIQSQILNLLNALQKKQGLSIIFVAHYLPVVFYVSDYVLIMYKGRVVEEGRSENLRTGARHPYSLSLLGDSKTTVSPEQAAQQGCAFYSRCPLRKQHCREEAPELRIIADGQKVACHEV